jgi:hypothetical protein
VHQAPASTARLQISFSVISILVKINGSESGNRYNGSGKKIAGIAPN